MSRVYPKAERVGALLVLLAAISCQQAADAETQLFRWGVTAGSPPAEATNLVAVAGGDGHIVALRADGRVFAWGQNDYGQTIVPPDVTNAVGIAAGSTHSLALLDDGTIRFWGNIYTTGVTSPPPAATANNIAIAQGGTAQHVLTLRSDGIPVEWGNSSHGLASVPAKATNIVDLAVASFHSLALRADGTLVTWGQYYPLGIPIVPARATNIVAIAAGFSDDLALRADGSLVHWGQGVSEGTLPPGATNIMAIACGGGQRLALRADGVLLAWTSGGQVSAVPSGLSNIVGIAATTTGNLALMATDGLPLMGPALKNSAAAGSTARFRPLVLSSTPLSYQWMYHGTNLPGATGTTLVLTNVQQDQAGAYGVVASNAFGAVTNSDFSLRVVPVVIQVPPQSQTAAGGTTVTFNANFFGQGPFGYQWQSNGTNLPGATNSSLVLTNVQVSQAGAYSLVISNASGIVTSPSANLAVSPLFITTQPLSQLAYVGSQPSLSVATAGTGPYSYQWQFYGTNLPAATNDPLVLSNVQLTDEGPYSVTVSNVFGAVQSSNAVLTVVPILLTVQPQSHAAFLGQTVSFNVGAQAGSALSYQWQFNGADLPAATTSTLTLTSCQYHQAGSYQAIVTDSSASTNSAEATLAVSQVASWGLQDQSKVPASLSNLAAIAGHALHSLALKADGTVVWWGSGGGDAPAWLTNVVAIAAGSSHDLALDMDGTIIPWGLDNSGVTDVPGDLTNAISVAAGDFHSVALQPDGRVRAWGNDANGQSNPPTDLTNVVAIAAGGYHSLALRADGTVVAWGYNGDGETNVPAGLSNVVAIAGGDMHSLALKADGAVVVWGATGFGIPNVPPSATNVVAIAAGYGHCLVLKSDGTVVAWGYSSDGETVVPGDLTNVVGIAAGGYHSLALVWDGTPRSQAPLAEPAWGPAGFSVSLPTRSGGVYLLEYKNSLTDTNWIGLPLVAGNGGLVRLSDPAASGQQRFYRVRQW